MEEKAGADKRHTPSPERLRGKRLRAVARSAYRQGEACPPVSRLSRLYRAENHAHGDGRTLEAGFAVADRIRKARRPDHFQERRSRYGPAASGVPGGDHVGLAQGGPGEHLVRHLEAATGNEHPEGLCQGRALIHHQIVDPA